MRILDLLFLLGFNQFLPEWTDPLKMGKLFLGY